MQTQHSRTVFRHLNELLDANHIFIHNWTNKDKHSEVLFDMKKLVKVALLNELKYNNYVWNGGNNSHQGHNVWVPQNTLHYDFVLDFLE